jgi:aryl-alcohol dehydrogenase-like predicted oxidoreductase
VTASIIGATSMDHLRTNVDAAELRLSPELLAELDAVYDRFPDPCP